jgi:hypothetical protein
MVGAVKPGGMILDLQVIRPDPRVEIDGRVVCEIDGEPLFRKADAATSALDALVRAAVSSRPPATTTTFASTTPTART